MCRWYYGDNSLIPSGTDCAATEMRTSRGELTVVAMAARVKEI